MDFFRPIHTDSVRSLLAIESTTRRLLWEAPNAPQKRPKRAGKQAVGRWKWARFGAFSSHFGRAESGGPSSDFTDHGKCPVESYIACAFGSGRLCAVYRGRKNCCRPLTPAGLPRGGAIDAERRMEVPGGIGQTPSPACTRSSRWSGSDVKRGHVAPGAGTVGAAVPNVQTVGNAFAV